VDLGNALFVVATGPLGYAWLIAAHIASTMILSRFGVTYQYCQGYEILVPTADLENVRTCLELLRGAEVARQEV
jgi:hypothetical protein